jgi:hypothetical protein
VIGVALALVLAASSTPARASLPRHGVLVPGQSLAGVRLGATPAAVRARWGRDYSVCDRCGEPTWYFTYEHSTGEPLGAGVSFRRGRASAIFTLGAPRGWRTREGLRLGDGIDRVQTLYGGLAWKACIGYQALSMRRVDVVTSIYADGESVYGFALTRAGESICR